MKIRDIRRYIFIKLSAFCLVGMFVLYVPEVFYVVSNPEDIKFAVWFYYFKRSLAICALLAYFLFLFEVPIRFVIMKFILKKEEKPVCVLKHKKLDGFLTGFLWTYVFYGPLAAFVYTALLY